MPLRHHDLASIITFGERGRELAGKNLPFLGYESSAARAARPVRRTAEATEGAETLKGLGEARGTALSLVARKHIAREHGKQCEERLLQHS